MSFQGFVYLIHNKINGKYYVGKTVQSLARRWQSHIHAARRGSRSYLHCAIRKYGAEQFVISPLMATLTSNEQLLHWEKELIALFRANDPARGYNLTEGGEGVTPSPRISQKMREAWQRKKARGYKQPAAFTTRGRVPWNKGKSFSDVARKNMSAASRKSWTPERRAAQAERARKQRLDNIELTKKLARMGAKARWE